MPDEGALDHIAFDLDGTLVDTREQIALSLVDALPRAHRDPDTIAVIRRQIGMSPRAVLARYGVNNLNGYWRAHARNATACQLFFADLSVLLTEIAHSGTGLSVLTSLPHRAALVVLEATGLAPLFRRVDGAGSLPYRKPSPAALIAHLEHLGTASARVAYVGDTAADMQMARGARVLAIGVAWSAAGAADLRDAGANAVIDHFAALHALCARAEGSP
jgi:phosphoglycolate phosphatase